MLSDRTRTWCPLSSCKNSLKARSTATISRQFMCQLNIGSAQEPKVGLPSHSVPQPVLEVSVMTTFFLETKPSSTPI